jgi:hypothetical protein
MTISRIFPGKAEYQCQGFEHAKGVLGDSGKYTIHGGIFNTGAN